MQQCRREQAARLDRKRVRIMGSTARAAQITVVTLALSLPLAFGQSKQEKRFTCSSHPVVSVSNEYGPVWIRPGAPNQVVVIYLLASPAVELDSAQSGDRITLESHLLQGANPANARVEYELLVPPEAAVFVRSSDGPLTVESLRGDVTAEGSSARVNIRYISNAHVHVKTLDGPVTLNAIRQGHVEVTTVRGAIMLTGVTGPMVNANSASGKISYDGDFGDGGQYRLVSHTGDIDASMPANASVDLTARSAHGQVDDEYALQPKAHTMFPVEKGRSLVGTTGRAASSVLLNTISGKIRLKKH
jgi:hypothetical protein